MSKPRPLLLVTATVHLDSQWRWTVRDTIRDFLPATLNENFALFGSHPNYVLSFEGAFRYMLVQEYYPQAWDELRHWCREGRWVPVGGMLDAPDVNVVSPESLIRHVLYGNGFFERELGVRSRDVFLPDCFGFSHALPSVAAHCGLDSFSSSKLIKWKAPGSIPFDIGRWRGPDGSEVLAVLKPGGYGEGIDEDLSCSAEWLRRTEAIGEQSGVAAAMRYVGTGDRGGSPDRESLDRLEVSVAADGPVEVRCAPSDAIQDEFDAAARARLPLHDSEILLPTHGTGCWTSQAALKRWNRRNELLATAAERAAVVADWLGELDYPGERIAGGWLRFLWHQMHDDLPGTSIPAAYEISWNDQAVAANLLAGVLTDSVAAIAERLDTESAGLPLLVYNPTSHTRDDVVEAILERSTLPEGILGVVSPGEEPVPTQLERVDEDHLRLLFPAAVGPLSFSTFELLAPPTGETAGAWPADDPTPTATSEKLENHRYRVGLDRSGDIGSIYDKRLGRELLREPLRLELLRDRSDRWPAWEIRPETILDAVGELVAAPATITVTESGPVRAAVAIERRFAGSFLRQTVRLACGSAGERLEILNELDWRTRGRLLKAAFPLEASNPLATYDLGLGTIRRDNNTPERYEVPAQQWAELTDGAGDFGTAILNDGSYGWDKPADDELRLSLVRSPSSIRKYPHQRTQDLGRHRFTIALMGHAGEHQHPEICRQAERLNQPPLVFSTAATPGDLGRDITFLQTDDADLSITALKKSERDDRYVVRLRDLAGGERRVGLRFPSRVDAAVRLRGDEHYRADLLPAADPPSVEVELGPYAIETLAVDLARPAVGGRSRAERPVSQVRLDLPFDCRATSSHDDAEAVDFDGRGSSIPGELFPETLVTAGVELRFGPRDGLNALTCRGQELEIPPGHRQLWLVLASTGGDVPVELEAGAGDLTLTVRRWTGKLAERAMPPRWHGLRRGRDGYLITDELAWVGTHRHKLTSRSGADRAIEDEAYTFCYLFRYPIEIPAGTTRVQLPRQPRAHLFAATAVGKIARRPQSLQDLYGAHS